jgi:lipopolysaccharide transport system ATP-binding protein
VFLNGAILGMSKTEINKKFDAIVDFAGVERYIDTPVKRYSSGMYVRLAFAVAAFLEPEILIVDEVLAVGDAEFQKKCLGRMKDVSVNDGRTVLFVSHSMSSIKTLCTKGIVMKEGRVEMDGNINSAVQYYFNLLKEKASHHYINNGNSTRTRIKEIFISDEAGNLVQTITNDMTKAFLVFVVENKSDFNVNLGTTIFNSEGLPLLSSALLDSMDKMEKGEQTYKLELPISIFKADEYSIEAALWDNNGTIESHDCYIKFKMDIRSKLELTGNGVKGLMLNPYKWTR